MGNLLSCPLVGCLSHRLNLGVEEELSSQPAYYANLDAIHHLMTKLDTLKLRGWLTSVSELAPVKMNKTRWSSKYQMILRILNFFLK